MASFRQVRDIEWCVVNVLGHAERLAAERGARSMLFPMLGTGTPTPTRHRPPG